MVCTYSITEFDVDAEGEYICKASNNYGPSKTSSNRLQLRKFISKITILNIYILASVAMAAVFRHSSMHELKTNYFFKHTKKVVAVEILGFVYRKCTQFVNRTENLQRCLHTDIDLRFPVKNISVIN